MASLYPGTSSHTSRGLLLMVKRCCMSSLVLSKHITTAMTIYPSESHFANSPFGTLTVKMVAFYVGMSPKVARGLSLVTSPDLSTKQRTQSSESHFIDTPLAIVKMYAGTTSPRLSQISSHTSRGMLRPLSAGRWATANLKCISTECKPW